MHHLREKGLPFLESKASVEVVDGGIESSAPATGERLDDTVRVARFRDVKLPIKLKDFSIGCQFSLDLRHIPGINPIS